MKLNFTPLLTVVCFAFISLASTGCKKDLTDLYDKFKKGHGAPNSGTFIKKISVLVNDETGMSVIDYNFNYNKAGDPSYVINNGVSTGHPNVVFKYDKRGRLTDMIRPYDNNFYESWTKYIYNNRNQIVRDTQYIFGSFHDSIPVADPSNGYWTSDYKYDGYERISSRIDSTFYEEYAGSSTFAFQYDTKGDLISEGASYDEGINFAGLSKVWMFVCNNYCVNNNFRAISYNTQGLPLSFDGTYNAMSPIVTVGGRYTMTYGTR